jgi:hypothetical protein
MLLEAIWTSVNVWLVIITHKVPSGIPFIVYEWPPATHQLLLIVATNIGLVQP